MRYDDLRTHGNDVYRNTHTGIYVNTPVSKWLLDRLTSAFPAVPRTAYT